MLFVAPVSLARTPTVGAKASYAMRATIDLGDRGEVRYSGKVDETIKAVEKGLLTTAVEATTTVEAMAVSRQGRPVVSNRIERLEGTLVTPVKADEVILFATARVDRLRAFYVPSAPVEVGGAWWHTEGRSEPMKAPPFASYLKLEGEERVGARDTWRVSLDANEVEDEHPTHVKAMLWIDKADGALERGQWQIDGFTYSPTAPPSTAKLELSRTD